MLHVSDVDGLVTLRVPADWYTTTHSDVPGQTALIATPNPERAATPTGPGDTLIYAYVNQFETPPDVAQLVDRTLKDHGLQVANVTAAPIQQWGLGGTHYSGATDQVIFQMRVFNLSESGHWVRLLAFGSAANWEVDEVAGLLNQAIFLPQVAEVPRGWSAAMRAPAGWASSTFSSFVQWTAPPESELAGTEVWFQAGFRSDLIGEGDPPFVLRTLGVNYLSQVDESQAYDTILGGLAAQAQPFESFTHTGIAISALGASEFGAANLIMRAPLGAWSPAHAALLTAMAQYVRITPPTAEDAPVGLRRGYRAPAFSATLAADDTPVTLDDYAGDLVFLRFWFVDCPYCREEAPGLQAVYEEYAAQGMTVLNVNAIDPPEYIAQYSEQEGYTLPLVLDDGRLHDQFAVAAFPTTYVIGPDGTILQVARGPLSARSIRNLATQHLGD
ncbi:MAG: peroxiredoxin family protein [Anaerolineales bacterium]